MMDFNQAAANWDSHPERRKRSEEIATAILENAGLSAEMDLLEFGCGTGQLGLALRSHVRSLTACDTAREMLSVVEQKAQGDPGVRTLLVQGGSEEKFPVCDAIVSSMALHHVEDVAGLFCRFFTALRPGGCVALADLDPENGLFHPDPEGVFHNGFDHAELRLWLENAGFAQIDFHAAARMRKVGRDGVERDFSIFLVVARKPAGN